MPATAIRDVAVPLRSLDPAESDLSDLDALREVVGDARVVCLGESAHFTAEFAQLRDRLLRFLVRELGFSAFVLESGLPEGLAVDEWVRGGPGQLADIARSGITYTFGRCTETHTQLRWMREWNTTHTDRPVRYYGMDVPGWCANPGPGVAACLARLTPRPGDADLFAAADLGEPGRAPSVDASDSAGFATWVARGIAELVDRATAAGDQLAVRCARGAHAVVEFLEHGMYPGPGRNLRNEVMAENLRWILNREDRVLVNAHNMHLQYAPSWDGTMPVGRLLTPELGEDLIVIGATHALGAIPDHDPASVPAQRYFTWDGDEPPPTGESYPRSRSRHSRIAAAPRPPTPHTVRSAGWSHSHTCPDPRPDHAGRSRPTTSLRRRDPRPPDHTGPRGCGLTAPHANSEWSEAGGPLTPITGVGSAYARPG